MTLPDREAQRLAWTRTALDDAQAPLERASADASFRSYWRSISDGHTWIVMDAPPDKEDIRPWLDIAARLTAAGLHAPEIRAADADLGFVLMADLGTRLYLPELDDARVDALYADALDALLTMQTKVHCADLPAYDAARLATEMELMPEWLLKRHLGFEPSCDDWDVIELAFGSLIRNAENQPQAFVHRDYHSRNLLITELNNPGILDFQDAVRGPVTYDLVSLLRDCYIAWPDERVQAWVEAYRQRLIAAGIAQIDAEQFRRAFDLMGLQRHIKVLGIFCRLWYRDGKAGYLNDLPLVWRYTRNVGRRYPDIAPLIDLIERALGERDITVPA
ncbi:MAG TPA: phosphotransferase [Arenimonas sp.]|uniref:aminoglycoside phosphotransferase family protein n=1 Tax=Arenimonas sp. TaxID=1872635 RepID=UPI002C8EC0F1|nr:phosphotransferase [Arenimonas sp.]HMB56853.1 phosphotransferase [Arenimonas sp.]